MHSHKQKHKGGFVTPFITPLLTHLNPISPQYPVSPSIISRLSDFFMGEFEWIGM